MGKTRYSSVNAKPDTYERMQAFKDGGEYQTMDDALAALLDYYDNEIEPEAVTLDDATVEQLVDELGAAVGGPQVDDSDLAREVAARIDYEELGRKTADKIREDLR